MVAILTPIGEGLDQILIWQLQRSGLSKVNTAVDRWRDAVSPGSSPSASDDFDLLPCDISPDFLYRGAYRGNNVPGA